MNSIVGVPSSDHFHKSLLEMRKRWKLRRTNVGIVGDLGYRNTGMIPHVLECRDYKVVKFLGFQFTLMLHVFS